MPKQFRDVWILPLQDKLLPSFQILPSSRKPSRRIFKISKKCREHALSRILRHSSFRDSCPSFTKFATSPNRHYQRSFVSPLQEIRVFVVFSSVASVAKVRLRSTMELSTKQATASIASGSTRQHPYLVARKTTHEIRTTATNPSFTTDIGS